MSRRELNAERFARRSVSDHRLRCLSGTPCRPGHRLCRTGDRARWRADGQIEFLGRADNQVKIRGFRVEPGEIEEVLGEHPALAQAAVAARQRAAGDLRLVAYVVGKAGAVPDAAEMKQFLAQRVPDYMIPSAFVTLSALPTTASGKVDRKALPAPDWTTALAQGEFVAPRAGTEQQLAAIWSEVLRARPRRRARQFLRPGRQFALGLASDCPRPRGILRRFAAGHACSPRPRWPAWRRPWRRCGSRAQSASGRFRRAGRLGRRSRTRSGHSARLPNCFRRRRPGANPAHRRNRIPGAYLLRELLRQTDCGRLLPGPRGKPRKAGRRSPTTSSSTTWRLPKPRKRELRVIPVCGDLAEPRLGLSPEDFDSLAATIDAVYHNGAYVNFVYPYQVLKPANVAGTIEVLRLATQTKVKPLHFVSTVSVFDSPEYAARSGHDRTRTSRWMPSAACKAATPRASASPRNSSARPAERGLPVAVYRPGRVTADSETGAESLADYTTLLLRLCIEMKMAPSSDDRVDMTPVDYVAQAIVGLAQRPESTGKTFTWSIPAPCPCGTFTGRSVPAVTTCKKCRSMPGDASAIQWGSPVARPIVRGLLALVDAHDARRQTLPTGPTAASSPDGAPGITGSPATRRCRDLQPLA